MTDIIIEAKRCLKCKNALCRTGCPVDTPINKIIELFLAGRIEEAGKILFENNPLSALCSLICPHDNNCAGHCVLSKKGESIKFYEIEHYISTFYLEKSHLKKPKTNNRMIGIIGAGPAGLTLAFILAERGYKVTIFDSKDKIGGVLRYGIPDFRLPKILLDKLLIKMQELGIKFRPNTLVGPTITIDDMFEDGYDAIFIGTGVWNPNRLHIQGESLGNVHYAIDYLKNPDSYLDLGDKVVIIGAGNVAMDAARTILRKNQSQVTIIFFRGPEDVTARADELELARLDGVQIRYYLNTVRIFEDGVLVEPVIKTVDADGKINYVSDTYNRIKIDATSVIVAIGQGPLTNIVKSTNDINTSKRGLIIANGSGKTTRPGVFAAGDVVSGSKTVVEAVAYAKIVANEIEEYIKDKYENN